MTDAQLSIAGDLADKLLTRLPTTACRLNRGTPTPEDCEKIITLLVDHLTGQTNVITCWQCGIRFTLFAHAWNEANACLRCQHCPFCGADAPAQP